MSRRTTVLTIALALMLALPASASAAATHLPILSADILGTVGGAVGSVFSHIGHAVLGAFSWTIELASKFILTTIGALVKLLIPHSWVHKGLQIMAWIVAVPDYAGTVASPGGGHAYGFAGINQLRDLFTWLGVAIAPLTVVYATSRAMIGEAEPVGIPLLRMLAVTVVVISYPYWWEQAAALADQVTHTILYVPAVSRGLYKLMDYAVTGVALGGWQLIDLALMAAIGGTLLGLIFLKVVLILLGALLYATGPLMIGLAPTKAGNAFARAWAGAAGMLLAVGIVWATLFAVGALLIGDAGTAGPLIAGNSSIGELLGGLLLAVAGLASLWLCLKAAREAAGLLRMQLGGLLALSHHSHSNTSTSTATTRARTTGQSLRDYGSRLARAAGAAAGEVAFPGGPALASAGRAVGYVGRRGIIGTAAVGARLGAERAAGPTGALLGRSRAGAVAARMARTGTASWTAAGRARPSSNGKAPQTPRRPGDKPSERATPSRPGAAPINAATLPVSTSARGGAGTVPAGPPGSSTPSRGNAAPTQTGTPATLTPSSPSSGSLPAAPGRQRRSPVPPTRPLSQRQPPAPSKSAPAQTGRQPRPRGRSTGPKR